MKRLIASLSLVSLVVGCSPSPTAPVARVNPRVSLDCSNGNNGNNPPNTANGGCSSNTNGNNNASNNPPTTAGN